MRRLMFAAASIAVFAFVPASALAQHHGRHHKRHHHHHAHIRRFGDVSSPGSPTTTPTPSQSAGTVASFSNGVLTITLNDGSTVSGAVTNDTEIECMAPDTSGTMQRSDDGPGDNGGGDQGGSGDGDHGDNGGPGDDDNGNQNNCSSADLTQGAMVAEGAELKITSSGNVWDKVELITSSTSGTGSSGDDDGGSD